MEFTYEVNSIDGKNGIIFLSEESRKYFVLIGRWKFELSIHESIYPNSQNPEPTYTVGVDMRTNSQIASFIKHSLFLVNFEV